MNRKNIIIIFLSLLVSATCFAQDDWEKSFDEFRKFQTEEYEDFYSDANEEFSKALKNAWEKFRIFTGEGKQSVDPDELPRVQPGDSVLESIEINIEDSQMRYQSALPPNITDSPAPSLNVLQKNVLFSFYNKTFEIAVPIEYGTFHPSGINEKSVGEFWAELASYNYNIITSRFLKYRFEMNLNDWGTYKWADALSKAIYPENINDEQVVFTVFILNQIGLLSNIARVDSKLTCIFAASQQIYAKPYTVIEEQKFYLTEDCSAANEIFTYKAEPCRNLHTFDMNIYRPFTMDRQEEPEKIVRHSDTFSSELEIPVIRSTLAFYEDYPQTDVNVYAAASPGAAFAESLKRQLKQFTEGKSICESINLILQFLQNDFKYLTDQEQFGKEKPFFCEEDFFYPANDCEDRSILFCFLVKELLGLDYILIQYDNHVDCAVCIDEEIKGYFVRRKDKKYYICDPTYIGARIGMSSIKSNKLPEKVWFFS